jgi:hypothetical protein
VCYIPCPSHSWYRLSHLLKIQHWAPDCSCNCSYAKFHSENKGLTEGQNFQEWMQAAIHVTCLSYLVHSKRIHSQFQTIMDLQLEASQTVLVHTVFNIL